MTAGPAMMAQTGALTRGDPGIAGAEHIYRFLTSQVVKPCGGVPQTPKVATSKSSRWGVQARLVPSRQRMPWRTYSTFHTHTAYVEQEPPCRFRPSLLGST